MIGISQFKSEMDIHGKPKHPYFDELESDMAQLAQVDIASGKAPDLSELYEKAMWSNSTVRSKLLQSQQTETKKNQEQERQAKLVQSQESGFEYFRKRPFAKDNCTQEYRRRCSCVI